MQVDLGSLQDTVPTDRVIPLRGRWGPLGISSGEILLRLTYKRYVEDEEDDASKMEFKDSYSSDDEIDSGYKPRRGVYSVGREKESFMDVLAALIMSEEFQGIVTSEAGIFDSLSSRSGEKDSDIPPYDSQNLSATPGGK